MYAADQLLTITDGLHKWLVVRVLHLLCLESCWTITIWYLSWDQPWNQTSGIQLSRDRLTLSKSILPFISIKCQCVAVCFYCLAT